MAIQKLSQVSAFVPGADLWILPPLEKSAWTRKIDWYLNFQISKSRNRLVPHLHPHLEKIIKDNGMPFDDFRRHQSTKIQPLLIASRTQLPNKMTLEWMASGNETPKEWITNINLCWRDLNQPSLRLFLPADMNFEEFLKFWPENPSQESEVDITVLNEVNLNATHPF